MELGNKPLKQNEFIHGNSCGSSFTTNFADNEAKVKEIIKKQKEEGFKNVDAANFIS